MSRDDAIALANQSFTLMDEIDAALRESSAIRMGPIFERVLTNNAPIGIVEAVDWDLAPDTAVRQNMSTITSVGVCTCPTLSYSKEVLLGSVTIFYTECSRGTPEKTDIGLVAYINGIDKTIPKRKQISEGRKNIPPHLLNDQPQIANSFLGTNNQYLQNFVREDLWDLYDIS